MIISSLFFVAPIALAQPVSHGRIDASVFGGKSGIVRGNPFYGSKYLLSDAQEILLSNRIKRADLQFDRMNQKAADLLTISEVTANTSQIFADALNDYQRSALLAGSSLNLLSSSDFTGQQWKAFGGRAVVNLKFIDDLKMNNASNKNQAILLGLEDTVTGNVVRFLSRIDQVQVFIDSIISSDQEIVEGFSDLRDAELLTRFAEKARLYSLSEASYQYSSAAQELYSAVATRLWEAVTDENDSLLTEVLQLSGSATQRALSIKHLIELQPSLSTALLLR